MRRLSDLPFIVILMGIGSAAMYLPAAHGFAARDYDVSRAFFYSATICLMLTVLIAIATAANRGGHPSRNQLLTLLATFTALPVMLALPFSEAVPSTTFYSAWWEMVSSLTSTGASLFEPDRLPATVHLWRALVGWMGGFFVLVTAAAILAPMNLGGFEVLSGAPAGQGAVFSGQAARAAGPADRIRRHTLTLLPAYAGLTLALWIGLILGGDGALTAAWNSSSRLGRRASIAPIITLAGKERCSTAACRSCSKDGWLGRRLTWRTAWRASSSSAIMRLLPGAGCMATTSSQPRHSTTRSRDDP